MPTTLNDYGQHKFLTGRLNQMTRAILEEPDRTALWIGAGLSTKYGGLPTWSNFLRGMAETTFCANEADRTAASRLVDSGRMRMAAEFIQQETGGGFIDALSRRLATPSGQLPENLAYLNPRDIITTNYDDLIERLLPWYKRVLMEDGMRSLISNEFKIVKIHGTIDRPRTCVASITGYATAYGVDLNWYISNLFSANTVIFLGSSMNRDEPFFEILRFLRENNRLERKHFAVVSVESDDEASVLGSQLEGYGIQLLPFVPDKEYSFLDEIFNHLNLQRGSPSAIKARLENVNKNLQDRRFFHAAATLWHASHAPIEHPDTRRRVGDSVSLFFERAFGGLDQDTGKHHAGQATSEERGLLLSSCKDAFELADIWVRGLDLIVFSEKSAQGFTSSLDYLERGAGRRFPILRERLREKIAAAKAARSRSGVSGKA